MPNYRGGLGYGNRSFVGQADGGLRSEIFSGGRAMGGSGAGDGGIGFQVGGISPEIVGQMVVDGSSAVPGDLNMLLAMLGGGQMPAGGESVLASLLGSGQVPAGVGLEGLGLVPSYPGAEGAGAGGLGGGGDMILGALMQALSDPAVWRSMLAKLR